MFFSLFFSFLFPNIKYDKRTDCSSSHANVHSQERPHYCPVQDCPRGIGGKGFKRKNEMIRHGLVHESPGYVCPFCTDQQHKYPRPDNLQRYFSSHALFVAILTSPDMSKHTTSTEARTIQSCAMCLHKDPKAVGAADGGGGIHETALTLDVLR